MYYSNDSSQHFDIIVIGAGIGGYTAALVAASGGARVAIVEKDLIGGTCLNRGCIPTKALLEITRHLTFARISSAVGLDLKVGSIDLSKVVNHTNSVVSMLRDGVETLLRSRGISVFRGEARVENHGIVSVDGSLGKIQLVAKNLVIATGSVWSAIPGIEVDGELIISSDHALIPSRIPARLVIVGGGAVGCEFAEIYSSLGSKVIVVEMMEQLLPGEDSEIARRLEGILRQKGIEVLTSSKVAEIKKGSSVEVVIHDGRMISTSQVMIAVGRKPHLDGFGLEKLGINISARGIEVDSRMRTNIEGIYAVGDVTGKYMLAHVAMRQGIVAADNILGKESFMDYRSVPRCVYTSPEFAGLGVTEEMASKEGLEISVSRTRLGQIGRAATMGEKIGLAKLIIENKTHKVIGFHILAPHASELIGEVALAIQHGLEVEKIAETIHAHPTISEIVWECASTSLGRRVHGG
ncbi:MAG: dihydrolipoyl dehydrogenase [bacterium]